MMINGKSGMIERNVLKLFPLMVIKYRYADEISSREEENKSIETVFHWVLKSRCSDEINSQETNNVLKSFSIGFEKNQFSYFCAAVQTFRKH